MTEDTNFSDAINTDNFKIAWKQLKKTFSKGLVKDPFEYLDYEINLENNIWNLVTKIKNDKYTPKTRCGVKIPIIEHTNYINKFMQAISV